MKTALSPIFFLTFITGLSIAGWFWPSNPETSAISIAPSSRILASSHSIDGKIESESMATKASYPLRLKKTERLWNVLTDHGFHGTDIHNLVKAARPYFDLGYLSSKIPFRIEFSGAENPVPSQVEFKLDADSRLRLEKEKNEWTALKIELPTDIKTVNFQGRVESTLWGSAASARMNPQLIVELAEIFAWQIDFAREVRPGDLWRISVEKKFVEGEFAGWGSITAAEYINAGDTHKAFRFEKDGELLGYFDENGDSLEKMFLKSPIKFGRISSRFSLRRFHPVKKVYRAHRGVDYAAPIGTPIRSVGDGQIVKIGRFGGAGKMIKIQHNTFYKTRYLHMSRFAKGMRKYKKVSQGQIIGYVGQTGLASGPHLHYEFYKKGRFVDPLKVKFPSATPVPKDLMADYKLTITGLARSLPFYQTRIAQEDSRLQFQ